MEVPERVTSTLTIPGIEDLEPIGRGGFGTVYGGWQEALHRKVAVKILSAPAVDAEATTRLQREAMAMGALSHHPNVVPVYATGSVDGLHYLVMPLLADGSLADQLVSGPLPATEVVELGRGLADALAAAHEAGVLHRDVKPANVLRTSHGTYQLADFGVARFMDATQTLAGSVLATVAYAAPEVLDGKPASAASDVYSLGATLHAALTGRPPFESRPDDVPVAMAVRVLTTEPPDLRAAGVPAELAEVVERAMAKQPAERHPSAADLRDALAALTLGAPAPEVDQETTSVAPVLVPAPAPTLAVATAPEDEPVHEEAAVDRAAPPSRRWILIAIALLLLIGGAALLFTRDEGGPAGGSAGEPTTTAETTVPETTAPETTAPQDVTTPPPTTAETSPPGPGAVSGVQAVRDYYALMDAGRIDEGFSRLSPAYQERTGEDSYRSFWQSIAGVEVLDAQGDDQRVAATLRYTRDDGSTSTESVVVELVRSPDTGDLLIDDYRVA